MTPVVVDASAVVEYLLRTERAERIQLLFESHSDVHAPALCDVEVCAGIRRALRGGSMSEERARDALNDYSQLPITRHGHLLLLGRALALRANFTAYDAAYLALAERLGADLLTEDHAFARAIKSNSKVSLA